MDVVVPSPVISPEIPIMKAAAAKGLPIWSEVEVACRVTDADIIGITGTNGKTTTTTLVGEIMKLRVVRPSSAATSATAFRNRQKIFRKTPLS